MTDLDTLRLTAGRGLQLPSLSDFAFEFPALSVAPGLTVPGRAGSPILQPSAVWNLEFDYDRGLPPIDSTVRTAVFVQRNDNQIVPATGTAVTVLPSGVSLGLAQNVGYSDAFGGELGIHGKSASGFRWNARYAFEMIYDHTSINKQVLTSTQTYQTGTPMSVVIAGVGYTWEKLEVDIQGRWQYRFTDYRSDGFSVTPVYVSDYITSRMRVGDNLTDHVTLALTGQQFNVSRLMQTARPPVERSIIGSVTSRF